MRWYGSLGRSGEIAYVRRVGRHVGRPTLTAFGTGSSNGPTRVCVTVSKSVGGAVLRNLVRRRIRGALDALPPQTRPPAAAPARIVIVARPAAATESYERLAADVRAALERLGRANPPQAADVRGVRQSGHRGKARSNDASGA